jgi:hypothetical protein
LPRFGKVNDVSFDATFWGRKFIVLPTIEDTAKTVVFVVKISWRPDDNPVFTVEENRDFVGKSNFNEFRVDPLNRDTVFSPWHNSVLTVVDDDSTTRHKLDAVFAGPDEKRPGARVTAAVFVVHLDFVFWLFVGVFPEKSVFTARLEHKVFTVKSGVAGGSDRANTVALLFSTVPPTAEADALVAVFLDPGPRLEDVVAISTWTFFNSHASTFMKNLAFWTVAAVNAVAIVDDWVLDIASSWRAWAARPVF